MADVDEWWLSQSRARREQIRSWLDDSVRVHVHTPGQQEMFPDLSDESIAPPANNNTKPDPTPRRKSKRKAQQ